MAGIDHHRQVARPGVDESVVTHIGSDNFKGGEPAAVSMMEVTGDEGGGWTTWRPKGRARRSPKKTLIPCAHYCFEQSVGDESRIKD